MVNSFLTLQQRMGSHLPVLWEASKLLDIKSVVELGCGYFSTMCFLNRDFFPNLQSLYSHEVSEEWISRVGKFIKKKDVHRWNPINATKKNNKIKKIKKKVDLFFVDGDKEHRLFVLREKYNLADIYIVHDINVDKYRRLVVDKFNYVKVFDNSYNLPSTAVASNTIDVRDREWSLDWGKFLGTTG